MSELTAALKQAEDEVEGEAELRLAAEGELARASEQMERQNQKARTQGYFYRTHSDIL